MVTCLIFHITHQFRLILLANVVGRMKSGTFTVSVDGFGCKKLGKIKKVPKSQIYGDLLNIPYQPAA